MPLARPQPIPYQGSKRALAPTILSLMPRQPIETLYEPFAGSAAVSIAAATQGIARAYWLHDKLPPLITLWHAILHTPLELSAAYQALWEAQGDHSITHYHQVRTAFNTDQDPAKLLYLLARCVKNAVRFNREGHFNQAPDKRRRGRHPHTMATHLQDTATLFQNKAHTSTGDYSDILAAVTPQDFVYLDPPYLGTSLGRNPRYIEPLDLDRFLGQLESLNQRGIRYILSFDGWCGDQSYGRDLSADLGLTRLQLTVGRSAQATLNGHAHLTIESLYLAPGLRPTL